MVRGVAIELSPARLPTRRCGWRAAALWLACSATAGGTQCPDGPYGQGIAGPAEQVGAWEPPVDLATDPIHAIVLPNGEVLWWGGTALRTWNAATCAIRFVGDTGASVFCSGHTHASDGRVIVIGGGPQASPPAHAFEVNSSGTSLERIADMFARRWYPTLLALSDGRLLALAGQTSAAQNVEADVPELFAQATWTQQPQLERTLALYPKVFELATPPGQLVYVSTSAAEGLRYFTLAAWGGSVPSPLEVGEHASALYHDGAILATATVPGDGHQSAPGAQWFRPASADWLAVPGPQIPRVFGTLVALPNGQIGIFGGMTRSDEAFYDAGCAVHAPEVLDVESGVWSLAASHPHPHMYHSSAILLSDGRVWLAGSGSETFPNRWLEVYRPWYWHVQRPVIEAAPSALSFARSYTIDTDASLAGKRVSLVRLGAVTHNFDSSQRFLWADATERPGPESDKIDLVAPTRFEAPPGYYYLSVVAPGGIPSVSRIVRLRTPSGGGGCGLSGVELLPLLALAVRRRAAARSHTRAG